MPRISATAFLLIVLSCLVPAGVNADLRQEKVEIDSEKSQQQNKCFQDFESAQFYQLPSFPISYQHYITNAWDSRYKIYEDGNIVRISAPYNPESWQVPCYYQRVVLGFDGEPKVKTFLGKRFLTQVFEGKIIREGQLFIEDGVLVLYSKYSPLSGPTKVNRGIVGIPPFPRDASKEYFSQYDSE